MCELEALTTKYNMNKIYFTDNILSIASGKFVAIVGASGSGKTTLLKLILGLEKIEKGIIQYDGQDLKELDIRSIRRQMGGRYAKRPTDGG